VTPDELRSMVATMRELGVTECDGIRLASSSGALSGARPGVLSGAERHWPSESPTDFADRMRTMQANGPGKPPAPGTPAADMVAGILISDEDSIAPEDQAEVEAFERWQRTGQVDG
jgi:hypothetical protein